MPAIEDVLRDAKRLVALLEDPSPGTFTWHEAVHSAEQALHAHFGGYIPTTTRAPSPGDLIVAYYERYDTYWAGRYHGPKQGMSHWKPLELADVHEKEGSCA